MKGVKAREVDGNCRTHVLEMHVGQIIVTSLSQARSAHGWREGCFNAGAGRILLAKRFPLLLLSPLLQCNVSRLRAQMQGTPAFL